MKKVYIIIALVLLIVIGVFTYMKTKEKPSKKCKITNIKYLSFGYSTGYMMNASVSYNLYIEDEKYYIDIKLDGVPEEEKVTKEVTENDIKNIEKALNEHDICKWDGFDKNDPNVLDGNSFTLYINYENNGRVHASGYEMYPDNYGDVKGSLESIFTDIYNR